MAAPDPYIGLPDIRCNCNCGCNYFYEDFGQFIPGLPPAWWDVTSGTWKTGRQLPQSPYPRIADVRDASNRATIKKDWTYGENHYVIELICWAPPENSATAATFYVELDGVVITLETSPGNDWGTFTITGNVVDSATVPIQINPWSASTWRQFTLYVYVYEAYIAATVRALQPQSPTVPHIDYTISTTRDAPYGNEFIFGIDVA